jgi:hypothetical protein
MNLLANALTHQVTISKHQHAAEKEIFEIFMDIHKKLKQQIIDAVDDTYLAELKHQTLGYEACSAVDLLIHLTTSYGQIHDEDIQANLDALAAD